MPAYQLHYFNGQGRAEVIRWLFHYADVPFEDVKYELSKWQETKKNFTAPFNFLPLLVVDGKKLSQSMAIARYVAKETGLFPKTTWDQARCDMLMDGYVEMYDGWNTIMIAAYFSNLDKTYPQLLPILMEAYKVFKKQSLQPFLEKYEQFLVENGTGVFVGNEVCLIDIAVSMIINRCLLPDPTLPAQFPNIGKLYAKVMVNKSVLAHLVKRGKESFM